MANGSNTNRVRFGPNTGTDDNWSGRATHFTLWRGAILVANRALTAPIEEPVNGQPIDFAPGDVDVDLTVGTGGTAAGADDILTKYLTDYDLEMRLHTGDPGSAGTANVMTGAGYAHQTITDWTVVE